jgi:DNA-binding NarL/FixJ family response regulator
MSDRILIVDDSATVRRIIRSYLETKTDFDVCGEAVDGLDAIKKATELKPSLVLLDLGMPQMNGVEATVILKGMMPDVRIILFTIHDELLSYKAITSAIGIDAVLSKMEGTSGLGECVRRLLRS